MNRGELIETEIFYFLERTIISRALVYDAPLCATRYSQYAHRFFLVNFQLAVDEDFVAFVPKVDLDEREAKGILAYLNSDITRLARARIFMTRALSSWRVVEIRSIWRRLQKGEKRERVYESGT
jgi:hypothetical protein